MLRSRCQGWRWWCVPVALCFVLIGAVRAGEPAELEDLLFDLQVIPMDGQEAPAFALESLEGKRVSLGELRGKPALVYFWATW